MGRIPPVDVKPQLIIVAGEPVTVDRPSDVFNPVHAFRTAIGRYECSVQHGNPLKTLDHLSAPQSEWVKPARDFSGIGQT